MSETTNGLESTKQISCVDAASFTKLVTAVYAAFPEQYRDVTDGRGQDFDARDYFCIDLPTLIAQVTAPDSKARECECEDDLRILVEFFIYEAAIRERDREIQNGIDEDMRQVSAIVECSHSLKSMIKTYVTETIGVEAEWQQSRTTLSWYLILDVDGEVFEIRLSDHAQKTGGAYNQHTGTRNGTSDVSIVLDGSGFDAQHVRLTISDAYRKRFPNHAFAANT